MAIKHSTHHQYKVYPVLVYQNKPLCLLPLLSSLLATVSSSCLVSVSGSRHKLSPPIPLPTLSRSYRQIHALGIWGSERLLVFAALFSFFDLRRNFPGNLAIISLKYDSSAPCGIAGGFIFGTVSKEEWEGSGCSSRGLAAR